MVNDISTTLLYHIIGRPLSDKLLNAVLNSGSIYIGNGDATRGLSLGRYNGFPVVVFTEKESTIYYDLTGEKVYTNGRMKQPDKY